MLSNTFCHLGLWDVELNKDSSHHLANLSCTWLVYYLLPVLESWVGPYQLNSFLIKPLFHASFKLPTWKTCFLFMAVSAAQDSCSFHGPILLAVLG